MTKDYYRTLGVDERATLEEIRRAYRKKAFDLHPDRNGGSRQAEEAFKELTEAYAVLADSDRRAAYDGARRRSSAGPGREFDPGDLFSDLFGNPAFASVFSQLAREFDGQGLRFDEGYLRRVFSGQQGGVFYGGFVFVGPLGGFFSSLSRGTRPQAASRKPQERPLPRRPGFLGRLLHAALPSAKKEVPEPTDVHYTVPVQDDVLRQGGKVRVSLPGPAGSETYDVQVSPGSRPGTRLRLVGRGTGSPGRRGDLYLELRSQG
jgi:DnaJ-class molecular chaperone